MINETKSLTKATTTGNEQAVQKAENKTQDATSAAQNNEVMGRDQFLNLLITQLQHQDPLNPMNDQEFAVQLAQFSSLDELIGINEKLDALSGGQGSDMASMASFLGQEVVLKDQNLTVSGGKGPNVLLDIPAGTRSARVDIMNQSGQVVASKTLDDVTPGRQIVSTDGLGLVDGVYTTHAVSVDAQGKFVDLDAKISGTVEGFVMEPESALLVNGVHVPLTDVVEVHKGKTL